MSARPPSGGHDVLDDDVNARWDRDLKRKLAAIRADEILRDLGRLQRASGAYQRRYALPNRRPTRPVHRHVMPAASRDTITSKPRRRRDGRRRGPTTPRRYPEMHPQRTQRDASSVIESNPTADAERAADETIRRLEQARQDADSPDNAVAEQGWRKVARLSSRLHDQAHGIVVALEDHTRDQRELVRDSLVRCPEPTGRSAR